MGKQIVMGGAHEVPYRVDVESLNFTVIGQWDTSLCHTLHKGEIVYCWFMDGKYHAVVYDPHDGLLYDCAQYTSYSNFINRWLARFYPLAYLVSQYEPQRR